MITYCSICDVKSMKLHSIGIEIFIIEYCLRQPNYVLVSRHLKQLVVFTFFKKNLVAMRISCSDILVKLYYL